MDPRKTPEPVSEHLTPRPATPAEQAITQPLNAALDAALPSLPPQDQLPPVCNESDDELQPEAYTDQRYRDQGYPRSKSIQRVNCRPIAQGNLPHLYSALLPCQRRTLWETNQTTTSSRQYQEYIHRTRWSNYQHPKPLYCSFLLSPVLSASRGLRARIGASS